MIETTLYEPSLVGTNGPLLLAIKMPLSLSTGLLAFWAWRRPTSLALKISVMFVFTAYSITGSYFRPWYLMSVLELALIFAFFLDPRPKLFLSFTFVSFFSFFVLLWARWPNVPETAARLTLADWINVSMQLCAIIALTYFLILRARSFHRKSEASFVAIGSHAARVTHDLKGMLSAPLLYLDHAKAKLSTIESAPAELMDALFKTQKELSDLHLAVSELSRLTSLSGLPITRFSIVESLGSTSFLFQKELSLYDVQVELGQEAQSLVLRADRSLVVALLFEMLSLALSIPISTASDHSKPKLLWHFDPGFKCLKLQRFGLRADDFEVLSTRFEDSNLRELAQELKTPIKHAFSRDCLTFTWSLGSCLD